MEKGSHIRCSTERRLVRLCIIVMGLERQPKQLVSFVIKFHTTLTTTSRNFGTMKRWMPAKGFLLISSSHIFFRIIVIVEFRFRISNFDGGEWHRRRTDELTDSTFKHLSWSESLVTEVRLARCLIFEFRQWWTMDDEPFFWCRFDEDIILLQAWRWMPIKPLLFR